MSSPLRQNEYFMAKNEVSSEVIQADICRYLGNDARVKAGQQNVRLPPDLDCV
jgi:hypothetical protein